MSVEPLSPQKAHRHDFDSNDEGTGVGDEGGEDGSTPGTVILPGSSDQRGPVPVEEGNEGETPRGVEVPHRPTAQEVEEHNLTHCPPRSWCDHCVKGQTKDQPHRLSKGDSAESSVARVDVDYFFIKDDATTAATERQSSATARVSMICLCMQESARSHIWGYAVQQKGAGEKQVVEQIADDLATI